MHLNLSNQISRANAAVFPLCPPEKTITSTKIAGEVNERKKGDVGEGDGGEQWKIFKSLFLLKGV